MLIVIVSFEVPDFLSTTLCNVEIHGLSIKIKQKRNITNRAFVYHMF